MTWTQLIFNKIKAKGVLTQEKRSSSFQPQNVDYPVRVQASCRSFSSALFVSQILEEQEAFSVPKPADREGSFEGPQLSSAHGFEANGKLGSMGPNENEQGQTCMSQKIASSIILLVMLMGSQH